MRATLARTICTLVAGAALLALAGCGANQQASGPAQPAASATRTPALPTTIPARPTSTSAATIVDKTAIQLPTHVSPIPGWLHTDGTRIVDASGRAVTLAAVNWYGAEGPTYVPGGLNKRPYMEILLTIKALGFNAVRMPFSNEMVERNPKIYEHLNANKELIGMHALSIMDVILNGAKRAGLMVILVNHRSNAGWTAQENGLWYTAQYPESAWIADWVNMATRYKDNPAVAGFDLRNEPHSYGPGEYILGLGYLKQGATWGPYQGVSNPKSDWRAAAERAGDAILKVNPRVLIIVEGTQIYPFPNNTPDVYWWGGNLRGAMKYPVQLDVAHQLVYSVHEYGPQMHGQAWITPTMTTADWVHQFQLHWGDILQGPNAAPVWIGEFGTPHRSPLDMSNTKPASQGQWFSALVGYIKAHNLSWGYWTINGSRDGHPDSFGLLAPDWRHLARPGLMDNLKTIEPDSNS